MLKSGLVSVTFRQLEPRKVLELACEANLQGIEWGGDIHVPHGDRETASDVGSMTRDAGLEVAAYGSYYKLGFSEDQGPVFDEVLDTAAVLGAPTIRVWAGNKGTAEATEDDWSRVTDDAQRVADMARQAGLRVCLEYHGGTLTDHGQAAVKLHQRIDRSNLDLLWQPSFNHSFDEQIEALRLVLPMLSNTHVYHWLMTPGGQIDRRALSEDSVAWTRFFDVLRGQKGDHFALIEFVCDDDPGQLMQDAEYLNDLLARQAVAD